MACFLAAKPEGRVESSEFGLGKRQDALVEDSELGWGVEDVDYSEDDIVTQGARERWLSVLEPLSVQPLTIEGLPVVDKSIPVSYSAVHRFGYASLILTSTSLLSKVLILYSSGNCYAVSFDATCGLGLVT